MKYDECHGELSSVYQTQCTTMIAMAKTKTTAAKTANIKAVRKTSKRTGNGGGSNDPNPDESDDNDDLFPSSGGG